MESIVDKLLGIASAEIGTAEYPANSNKTKYGEWFGLNGVPWCGVFCSWCYDKAGISLGNIGFLKGFAGCQTAVAHFKATGQVVEKFSPGCLVFFDWNGDGRYDHVGIGVSLQASYGERFDVSTIEGNTSLENNSNGGKVMSRTRGNVRCLFVMPKVLVEAMQKEPKEPLLTFPEVSKLAEETGKGSVTLVSNTGSVINWEVSVESVKDLFENFYKKTWRLSK